MSEARFRVIGRVQGVGFRWFVRERARGLGVDGWVRNLSDGSVEVAARAPEPQLAALLVELRGGPPGARVDRVERLDPDPSTHFAVPFAILK